MPTEGFSESRACPERSRRRTSPVRGESAVRRRPKKCHRVSAPHKHTAGSARAAQKLVHQILYSHPALLYSADMSQIALSDLLGAAVYDPAGLRSGRVREVALCPQEDRSRVSALIVKTKSGDRL